MVGFIDDHRGHFGVEPVCSVLPIAPSYFRHKAEQAAPGRLSARAQPRLRPAYRDPASGTPISRCNAPSDLREALESLTDRKLIDRCARLLPGAIVDTVASTKHALRTIAGRWLMLSSEIDTHDEVLDVITQATAPTLREAVGIGPDSAAEMMMIVAGDNPTRIRSDAAFTRLCGACPIPASSGSPIGIAGSAAVIARRMQPSIES
jgi:hypothetical protein